MTKNSQFRTQVEGFDFAASYRVERVRAIKAKLLALHHFQAGKEIREVADMVLSIERSISQWIQRFIDFD